MGLLGLAMVASSLSFPNVLFQLVWTGLFRFLDVIHALTGSTSIAAQVAVGRRVTVLVLFLAGLSCGLFWEM